MSKVIIKGINEDGKIDAECKSTAVLVTELIERLPKMCEADIRKELEEIRLSSERDTRIRQTYAHILKEHTGNDHLLYRGFCLTQCPYHLLITGAHQ